MHRTKLHKSSFTRNYSEGWASRTLLDNAYERDLTIKVVQYSSGVLEFLTYFKSIISSILFILLDTVLICLYFSSTIHFRTYIQTDIIK